MIVYPAGLKKPGLKVTSWKEASEACSDFLKEKQLSAELWKGGQIIDNGKLIANVSYNGKVWLNKIDNTECLYNPFA